MDMTINIAADKAQRLVRETTLQVAVLHAAWQLPVRADRTLTHPAD